MKHWLLAVALICFGSSRIWADTVAEELSSTVTFSTVTCSNSTPVQLDTYNVSYPTNSVLIDSLVPHAKRFKVKLVNYTKFQAVIGVNNSMSTGTVGNPQNAIGEWLGPSSGTVTYPWGKNNQVWCEAESAAGGAITLLLEQWGLL